MTIARVACHGARALWGAVDFFRYGPFADHWLVLIHKSRLEHAKKRFY